MEKDSIIPDTYEINHAADVKPPLNPMAASTLEVSMGGSRENFEAMGELMAALFLAKLMPDGKPGLEVYAFPEINDEIKDMIGGLIVAARSRGEAVAWVCESWMAKAKEGTSREDVLAGRFTQPSKDPNRLEAVTITICDLLRQVMVVAYISRNGGKPSLGPWQVACDSAKTGVALEGRLAG